LACGDYPGGRVADEFARTSATCAAAASRHVLADRLQLAGRVSVCRVADGVHSAYQLHGCLLRNHVRDHHYRRHGAVRPGWRFAGAADLAFHAALAGWHWLHRYGGGDPALVAGRGYEAVPYRVVRL